MLRNGSCFVTMSCVGIVPQHLITLQFLHLQSMLDHHPLPFSPV